MIDFLVMALLVAGGLLGHFLGKLKELRKTEPSLTVRRYIQARPYQLAYSAVSAVVAAVALWHYGELTAITAVGVGYMSDSILDKIGNRTTNALR